MADPVSISGIVAGVGMASTAAGTLLNASGQSYAADAQANMFTYKAGVAQLNKQILLQNADYERKVGEVQAQEAGMQTRSRVAQTLAVQGASGLDVDRGSPADVRASEIEIGQQDQAIIRSNAAHRAFGFEVEALQSQAQLDIYGMSADTARKTGQINVMSSLISGGTSVADKWLRGRSVGLWGDSGSKDSGSDASASGDA